MNPLESPLYDPLTEIEGFTDGAPSYYHPSGRWTHMVDKPVEKIKFGTTLGYSMDPGDPVTYIAKGYANGKLVPLLCKRYDVWREWPGFHTEMYLYSSSEHLRPLQGKCVPHIISVQTIPGGYLTVNCELLSVNGWSDAHPDGKFISQEKKKRILEAYHRIHKQGVLHGSVSLHNIAISDDSRVHILDFRKSRALVSCRAVGLYSCTQEELDFEMRYVRFILDWNGAKRKEKEMWMGDSAGSQKQWLAADKARLQRSPTNIVPRQSHELWDVEKEE
ncbi:uncharacterized protein EI90DRAFT_2659230 [Cantharellus anzutake]|uniref:uncharacterized protein n=1 Tax=Cantharellus anzutake TaxID=1750568 RepID=UPI00190591A8|nr:uncharacterized protein EI90DRAFT_2659230 [Cantharellus anzutake]KAF8337512.1 hypothetical protein EI90DRAFT_2659230 [Cantharellus anzutake]